MSTGGTGGAGDIDATVRDAAYAELASTLWHERDRLEELLYALSCQHLVLVADGSRWLNRADGQVQDAVAGLADCEVRRAIATEQLLTLLELRPESSLDELAAASDDPWNTLFAEHRAALQALVAEIGAAARANRRLLQAGSELARQTLTQVGDVLREREP